MKTPRLYNKAAEIQQIAETLKGEKVIGIDTEFIRETTFFPKIALIQIATAKSAWLVDPTTLSKEELEPLLNIFVDPNVIKVVHAAYADQECFYWAYKMLMHPVLDTSVAAALCGIGDNIGLQKLLQIELDITIPKGRSRVKWLQRPLADELLVYAEEDVLHLVAVFEKLKEKLNRLGRLNWALSESKSEVGDFDVSPDVIALKIGKNIHLDPKSRGALLHLVRWRENRAKQKDLPRQWVADNDILVSICRVRPKTLNDLKSFRGLNAKEVERSGEDILRAVQIGTQEGENEPATSKEYVPRQPEIENHLVDFVQSYISFLARNHSIATRFLMNVPKISLLIRYANATTEKWVEEGILSSEASKMIGADLKLLLDGKRGLAIRKGEVNVIDVA